MKIRWEESVPKFGYLKLHLQDGTNRDATTEDLLLACKASGLVVVSAEHVGDMQNLKRECTRYERQAQELRAVLGGGPEGGSLIDAARRVVTERETAKDGLRECALAVGLVVQPAALLRENGPMDQVLGAIRNVALEAKERAAAVKAAEEAERLRFSERATIAQVDAVIVNRLQGELEAAIARAEKAEAEASHLTNVVVPNLEAGQQAWKLGAETAEAALKGAHGDRDMLRAERDALAAELAAIRAATGEEPTDEALYLASMAPSGRSERRALYNLGRTAAQGEVARMREEVATLRARVAELEAAPQGQPVATDEELADLFMHERSLLLEDQDRTGTEARRIAIRAVAARVRAERPACLVARAVALNVDVRVAEDVDGFLVAAHEAPDLDEVVHRDVPAADVPATLARLLDEVEAARKAVTR
jgi:hypothetical protein